MESMELLKKYWALEDAVYISLPWDHRSFHEDLGIVCRDTAYKLQTLSETLKKHGIDLEKFSEDKELFIPWKDPKSLPMFSIQQEELEWNLSSRWDEYCISLSQVLRVAAKYFIV